MKVTPKTEKELRDSLVWPDGEYAFEVIQAEDKTSRKGSEMIELQLRVFWGDRVIRVRDFLLDAMAYKVKHFCDTTGIQDVYKAGDVNAYDCEGLVGRLILGSEETEKYGKRNKVEDYVSSEAPPRRPKTSKPAPVSEVCGLTEIPF